MMTSELGTVGDELLHKYKHEVVQTFTNFCLDEQYDPNNIEEDIQDLDNSMIYECMQIALEWNDQQTNDFIQTLRNTVRSMKTNYNDHSVKVCEFEPKLNSTNIQITNIPDLLTQIKIRDKLSVFGFVREHRVKHNANIPIPIVNYCIMYTFELQTVELNAIINNELMLSAYKASTINTFFNFCKEQEYLEQTNILEDINEIDESFIAEHMELQCNWTNVECVAFINLVHLILTGKNMQHTQANKSVGFGAISPQIFQVIMNGYLPQYYDNN